MTRTELINILVKSHGLGRYLEIGCQRNVNFDKVSAELKASVDPDPAANATFRMTSDEFFDTNKAIWDLVFIDGLHHADQVERDIINAMRWLMPGGIIVLHDCNPPTEKDQLVPRRHKVWYGDVWRAFVGFRLKYPEVKSYCIADDCGCGIIHYTDHKIEPGFIADVTWDQFSSNRNQYLGLV